MMMLSKMVYDRVSGAHKKSPAIPEPPPSPGPGKPAPVVVHRLDFEELGLPEYKGRYGLVIDNLFTPKECEELLSTVRAGDADWSAALLNGGVGREQYLDSSYRNSSRIMVDDQELANQILAKIRPYLQDIETVSLTSHHKRFVTKHREGPAIKYQAELSRLNERLRFLRYGPGQFFKPHYDGVYWTPNEEEVSHYTLHMYLNGTSETLKGGATRFWTSKNYGKKAQKEGQRAFVDVESRVGRVLVFEQDGLLHSGEAVEEGVKISMRTDFMYVATAIDEEMIEG